MKTIRKSLTLLVLPLGLLLAGVAVQAHVEVRFVEPEKFRDANRSAMDRERTLQGLQAHLRELGDKLLPGKDLVIDVTDVDLAGEVEPHGRSMEILRVMRNVTSPSMELRFALSEGGKDLRAGKASLRDMNYLDGFNRIDSGDTLRYEKKMLDDWFEREFKAEIATAKPSK